MRAANRKQAVIPAGATVLDPVGTAPGLVVPPALPERGPTVVVLPGPPRELHPMWEAAVATDALRRAIAGATTYAQRTCACSGSPSPRSPDAAGGRRPGVELERLEITTCLRRGEIEVATRYEPVAGGWLRGVRRVHARAPRATRCSRRTARRSTSRSRGCCRADRPDDRGGGVVHRRAAVGAADRAGGVVGVLSWAASSCTRTRQRSSVAGVDPEG